MKIIVKQDQTIYDVALQYAGSLEAVVSILVANGKANTALLIGEELEIPDVLVARVAGFFNDKGWVPATSPKPLDPDGWVPPAGLDRKVQILIDNVFLGEILAPSSLNVAVVDQDGNPITPISSALAGGVATVGVNQTIDTKSWELQFLTGNADIIVMANTGNIATFASGSGTGIGTLTISTDGITYGAITYPFTPISGTTYYFKRSTTTGFAEYKMIE